MVSAFPTAALFTFQVLRLARWHRPNLDPLKHITDQAPVQAGLVANGGGAQIDEDEASEVAGESS